MRVCVWSACVSSCIHVSYMWASRGKRANMEDERARQGRRDANAVPPARPSLPTATTARAYIRRLGTQRAGQPLDADRRAGNEAHMARRPDGQMELAWHAGWPGRTHARRASCEPVEPGRPPSRECLGRCSHMMVRGSLPVMGGAASRTRLGIEKKADCLLADPGERPACA